MPVTVAVENVGRSTFLSQHTSCVYVLLQNMATWGGWVSRSRSR